jgi:hypothetical protein
LILRCDAGTQVESNLTCYNSTQTPNDNEQPGHRTDCGSAEKGKDEMQKKIAALEKFLQEKDCHIQKLNAKYKK